MKMMRRLFFTLVAGLAIGIGIGINIGKGRPFMSSPFEEPGMINKASKKAEELYEKIGGTVKETTK